MIDVLSSAVCSALWYSQAAASIWVLAFSELVIAGHFRRRAMNSGKNKIPPSCSSLVSRSGTPMVRDIDKHQWRSDMIVRPRDLVDRDIWYAAGNISHCRQKRLARRPAKSSISYRTPDTRLSLKTGDSFLRGRLSSRPDVCQLRTEIRAERRNDWRPIQEPQIRRPCLLGTPDN
jgi:hypothetical protein